MGVLLSFAVVSTAWLLAIPALGAIGNPVLSRRENMKVLLATIGVLCYLYVACFMFGQIAVSRNITIDTTALLVGATTGILAANVIGIRLRFHRLLLDQ